MLGLVLEMEEMRVYTLRTRVEDTYLRAVAAD